MSTESGILADDLGDAVWLRLLQRGCFQNSPDLERFINSRFEAGQRRFVVDLEQCGGLDSTFMGTLICAAKRLMKVSGCLHIINAAGRNAQLLRGLGVHYFCTVTEDSGGIALPAAPISPDSVPHAPLSKTEQTTHCLKAHVELADCCEENKAKFADVVEMMQKKCDQAQANSQVKGDPAA